MSVGLKITLSALLLCVLACDDSIHLSSETVVPPQCAEQYSKALAACVQAGNPLSDEEGEDLVAECRGAAADAWGAERPHLWDRWYGVKRPCDERCYRFQMQFDLRTSDLISECVSARSPSNE